MKTFKASVDTEIITSEDGLNTYEVIKKLSLPEGKCAYLISLYDFQDILSCTES